jgi:hypothetical protein
VCRSRPKQAQGATVTDETKYVNEQSDADGEQQEWTVLILSHTKTPPIQVQVNLSGKEVTMEIGTGASVSIPMQQWSSLGMSTSLEPANCTLPTYTWESVDVLGASASESTVSKARKGLTLGDSERIRACLLGRKWLNGIKLDWHNLHLVQDSSLPLKDIPDKHPALFALGLGTMRIPAAINMKPGTVPKFYKHQSILYALCEAMEEELERLQQSVIEKVDVSEWGTPLVCVRKKDGSIRLCGNYKVTLNQCMQVDQYPLP